MKAVLPTDHNYPERQGLIRGMTRKQIKAYKQPHHTTAEIHRSWAAYYQSELLALPNHTDRRAKMEKMYTAHTLAAQAADTGDKHAYNVVIEETGIFPCDFIWKWHIREQQKKAA